MFGGLVGPAGIAFVKQANEFGLFKLMAGAHPALGWPSNNQGLTKQDIPPNIITAGDYLYPPVDRPQNLAFIAAFQKRFHTLPLSEAANSYTTLKFIAAAFQKSGSLDREAFIDAAEGLTIDHPAQGPITLRAFDHQGTTGVWVGTLTWDAQDNRPGLANPVFVSSTKYLPTAAEVAAERAAANK
jgi:branched-chain amino acid transport system substrate-binding protein